jgi:hypothetical protein
MTDEELDDIEGRADCATPGPWFWRKGKHTSNATTSDAGGLHTKAPVEAFTPDGRRFVNENVIFPAAKVGGEADWVDRVFRPLLILRRGRQHGLP